MPLKSDTTNAASPRARRLTRYGANYIDYASAPRTDRRLRTLAMVVVAVAFGVAIGMTGAHAQTQAEPLMSTAQVPLLTAAADKPKRPPREAILACENQSASSACGFEGRDGEHIKGTCRSPASNVPAACVPDGMANNG